MLFACATAACILAFVLFRCIFGIICISSGSMEPTLHSGDVRFSLNMPYTFGDPCPERGSIIVFYHEEADTVLVKRLIAIGGDEVVIKDGFIYVNGEKQEEPYTQGKTEDSDHNTGYCVPEGCVFVLGDNREASWDSRYFETPYIPLSAVIGVIK